MKDDETLGEIQQSLRATHDPAQKIRPCSRDCGEIQKSTTGREKKTWDQPGSCWPESVSTKKKAVFQGNQDLHASETWLRAKATGRGNPGGRR